MRTQVSAQQQDANLGHPGIFRAYQKAQS